MPLSLYLGSICCLLDVLENCREAEAARQDCDWLVKGKTHIEFCKTDLPFHIVRDAVVALALLRRPERFHDYVN